MATQTTHYDMTKQQSPERVSVGLLNDNFDIIDGVMFANQEKSEQLADDYNASETYNTGDYVRRENYLYKCNTDNTTGTWDDTKWDRVKVMDEISQGGGGGSSTLAGLNDVSLATPTDGQLLGYNGTSHKWENVNGGGGGSSTFAGLNDVNVTGVQNGDIARYNSTTGKWTDSSDLSDLELTVADLQASVLGITDGHTVLASDGTAMAQEDGLQFVGSNVADDGTNGKTVVTTNIDIEQADYDALVANDADLPGVNYNITDAQPVAVNASNLPYDNTHSVKDMLDRPISHRTVWSGTAYTVNDEIEIANFSAEKVYVFIFKGYSGANVEQFITLPLVNLQFIIQGETTQYARYRLSLQSDNKYKITNILGSVDSGAALIQIDEIIK